jgi:hypothetical protein
MHQRERIKTLAIGGWGRYNGCTIQIDYSPYGSTIRRD